MPTNLTGNSIADTYDQLLHVNDGPEATEKVVYSGTGVATALKVGTQSASVDNIKLDGNTISTTDTNGNLVLSPNGTGEVTVDNLAISGNTISSTDTDGDIILAPNGTGTVNIDKANITGGSIGGAVSFAGGSFTSITLVSATTITGVTTTNGGNLRLTGNTLSSTDTNGNITISPNGTGEIVMTKPMGYGGASTGGTVTQDTSKSTGVTLNKLCGQITMHNAALSQDTSVSFVLTNSYIDTTDVLIVNIASGGTAGAYATQVELISSGSCRISLFNHSSGSLSEAVVLNFAVIKAVNA
jgi:hypothetical protein